MHVAIRADASLEIGTGHVMRCLTLAGELRDRGATVFFVSRAHRAHLCDLIEARGFTVHRLFALEPGMPAGEAELQEMRLGAPWSNDAEQTRAAIAANGPRPDWLIVDHYAIDRRWEGALRNSVKRLMVIDDLANRPHDCDLLLDQNFESPLHRRYVQLLPGAARRLLGPSYALVAPEFLARREASIARRDGSVRRILLSMGGTDPDNDTATALAGIAASTKAGVAIDVVIGEGNPHRAQIQQLCKEIPASSLHVQTRRMFELMSDADLAINGGGSTTWERCVLGLSAIVAIQSQDQDAIACAIQHVGGHEVLGWARDLTPEDYRRAVDGLTPEKLARMSTVSAGICDGRGAGRVGAELCNESW